MRECDFCGREFEEEQELHLHWGDEHPGELNSHQEEKVKKARRKRDQEKEARRRKRKKMLGWGLAATAALGLVAVLGIQLINSQGGSQTASFKLEKQPMMGNASAPVTVVEFGDYYCPYCQRFELSVKPRIKKNFIETGKARFYYVDLPLGMHEPYASSASRAAQCVYRQNEEEFWKFHRGLYESQREMDYSLKGFMELANRTTSGLDREKLRSCIRKGETGSNVEMDRRIARQNSVTSTPSVFVNGKKVDPNYPSIRSAIRSELR